MQLISKQITHPYICSRLGYLAWQLSRAMLFQWGLANRKCPVRLLSATTSSVWRTLYMYASSPLKNRAWGRRSPGAALSFCSDLTLSQEFQPMAAQLSIKAALPLAKIQVRQLYVIVVRQGPAWLVCVMSNATRLGGTVSGGTLGVRALAHGIAAPGFMPPAPAQSPHPPTPTPSHFFPYFFG